MTDTVAEAVEFAYELFKEVGDRSAQAANNTAPVALKSEGTEVVSLSASWTKTREEVVSAKAELNALRASSAL